MINLDALEAAGAAPDPNHFYNMTFKGRSTDEVVIKRSDLRSLVRIARTAVELHNGTDAFAGARLQEALFHAGLL